MSKVPMPATEAASALSQLLLSDLSLERTLQQVAELGCCVCGADVAGAFLLAGGKLRASAATGLAARELDEHQYQAGHGPAMEALRLQEPFLWDLGSTEAPLTGLARTDEDAPGRHVASTQRPEQRLPSSQWPDLARLAQSHGISSALALPVVAHENVLGVLNFYAAQPFSFDEARLEDMRRFANQAAIVIANSQVYWEARQLSENLNQALRSRATIDHAIGILMARGARTPEDAFALLVRTSQRQNRKLRDIAAEVVQKVSQGWQGEKGGLLSPPPSSASPAAPSLAVPSPRSWAGPPQGLRGVGAGSPGVVSPELPRGAGPADLPRGVGRGPLQPRRAGPFQPGRSAIVRPKGNRAGPSPSAGGPASRLGQGAGSAQGGVGGRRAEGGVAGTGRAEGGVAGGTGPAASAGTGRAEGGVAGGTGPAASAGAPPEAGSAREGLEGPGADLSGAAGPRPQVPPSPPVTAPHNHGMGPAGDVLDLRSPRVVAVPRPLVPVSGSPRPRRPAAETAPRGLSRNENPLVEPNETLVITGELDMASAPDLRQRISELLQPGLERVVLDLSGVEFIDAGGLSVLVEMSKLLAVSGSSLLIRKPSRAVRRLLDLLQMQNLLPEATD
jgi:anti-anti-sigma factor